MHYRHGPMSEILLTGREFMVGSSCGPKGVRRLQLTPSSGKGYAYLSEEEVKQLIEALHDWLSEGESTESVTPHAPWCDLSANECNCSRPER